MGPQKRECIMQGDAKVIEYLNKGLRHELTAINQYWLHFRLLHNWGRSWMGPSHKSPKARRSPHDSRAVPVAFIFAPQPSHTPDSAPA